MRFIALFFTALLLTPPVALATVPFWGDKESRPLDTPPSSLQPGQFIWYPDEVPSGPLVVVVSLSEQRAYVYRNGIRIGVASVSTGKRGFQTPTGVFTVLQKDKDHHSSTYNNAAMPYTERLTWDGVSLHAGGLPGYPSSHGCVHLPSAFAAGLFEIAPMGMTVVIADQSSAPTAVAHPSLLAPVSASSGAPVTEPRLAPADEFRWEPEKSPQGPLAMVVSGADRRILVYRNGVEIGRARVTIERPETGLGTHALVAVAASGTPLGIRWMAVSMPGHAGGDTNLTDPEEVRRIRMDNRFRTALSALLQPGVALLVTDAPVLESTTAVPMKVLTADPAAHSL
jgi:hypothetical protein